MRPPALAVGLRARLAWWLVGALLPWDAEAILYNIRTSSKQMRIILVPDFDDGCRGGGCGLDPGATISFDLKNERPANNTYIMVLTHAQMVQWGSQLSNVNGLPTTSWMVSYWRSVFNDSVKTSFKVNAQTKDRYWVQIFNLDERPLKVSGTVSLLNPGGEQLALQEQKVPMVLLWTSALFFGTCMVFATLLATSSRRGRSVMHLVMMAVLLLKGVVLLLWWCNRMQVARSGSDSIIGNVGWKLVEKVQTIMELMMFLFIALGWKFLRGTLNVTEMRFAGGISVISFYLGVFEVACSTPSTCSGYVLSRYILHALCWLVVIVAMNFNLQLIHAQIVEATASAESGKLYRKHHAYRAFRWIFLAFIVAPTVEIFLKVTVMPWDAIWLYYLVVELRTWAVYTSVVVAFRPDPPPLRVFDLTQPDGGSDDEAEPAPGAAVEE